MIISCVQCLARTNSGAQSDHARRLTEAGVPADEVEKSLPICPRCLRRQLRDRAVLEVMLRDFPAGGDVLSIAKTLGVRPRTVIWSLGDLQGEHKLCGEWAWDRRRRSLRWYSSPQMSGEKCQLLLLRGVLIKILPKWWPGPGEDEEHREAVIAVWCPHCREYHRHGWDPAYGENHIEHRVAHCRDPNSPFSETGYNISVFRWTDPESERHVVPPGCAIVRKAAGRRSGDHQAADVLPSHNSNLMAVLAAIGIRNLSAPVKPPPPLNKTPRSVVQPGVELQRTGAAGNCPAGKTDLCHQPERARR